MEVPSPRKVGQPWPQEGPEDDDSFGHVAQQVTKMEP